MSKRRKKPAKGVKLDPKFWLRNAEDVKTYREQLLKHQDGKCAVSNVKILVGCLDHTHIGGVGKEGAVRGVLLSEVNMLEGRYLKLFNRLKIEEKYKVDFPTFLIKMGEYLKQDNSDNLLHHKYMGEYRKSIDKLTKVEIQSLIQKEWRVTTDGLKSELLQFHVQKWVESKENN